MAELKEELAQIKNADGETYRDRIGIIDKKGARIWIYPKLVAGAFHHWRVIVSIILLVVLFGVPFIKVDGHPFIMLNILERKFILFGLAFWPQDFYLFALTFLSIVIFIVLFTAVFGRIWCGWACPQTIFMEMVFRKIEFWIEGDGPKQYALDQAPWNADKILKKTFKHIIFFAISWVIGNTLLAYIIGVDELFKIINDPIGMHVSGFTAMTIFSLIFYGIFSRFREQACIYVCPYGRLQSVLLDKNSIVVMYDFQRGEPRGKLKKGNTDGEILGDCIDCKLCVQVCPTGIDIRNGTQMECVNCTACMDACDSVMDKIKRPKNLIRYGSYNLISQKLPFKITPRIVLYSAVLTVLITVTSVFLFKRKDIQTTILRAKGPIFQLMENGDIRNVYTAKVLNKTFDAMQIEFKLEGVEGNIALIGTHELRLHPDELVESTFLVDIPRKSIRTMNTRIKIGVYKDGMKVSTEETSFVSPMQ